jgi:hypothetical protein
LQAHQQWFGSLCAQDWTRCQFHGVIFGPNILSSWSCLVCFQQYCAEILPCLQALM